MLAHVLLVLVAQPRPFCIHVAARDGGAPLSGVRLETTGRLVLTTDVNGNAAFYEPGLMGRDVFFSVTHPAWAYPRDFLGFEGAALTTVEGGTGRLDLDPKADGGTAAGRADDEETRLCMRAVPGAGERFAIRTVDDATGRPLPLVEVGPYVTDSEGLIAFYERAAMGRATFFPVFSHGYDFPDSGVTLTPVGDAGVTLRLTRRNVAERLYRVTGGGIRADSVLLGRPGDVLNAGVIGQDSVLSQLYRGRPFFIWGDTNRPGYPLGNFSSTGARDVQLHYFEDDAGFVRAMAPIPGGGPVWLSGLIALPLSDGGEELWASYAKVISLDQNAHVGLVRWNDAREVFEPQLRWADGGPPVLDGHPFLWQRDDGAWVEYRFGARVRATPEALLDPSQYVLVADAGALWSSAYDIETGKKIDLHSNDSVVWNPLRGRFVRLASRIFGDTSFLGDLYYQEGDTPLGPWVYARRVLEHRDYTFYNPRQHPFLDSDGGQVITFEGTYTQSFSGNPRATPRYDYNQVMYRLDLGDPRVTLPVPVYLVGGRWATKADVPPGSAPLAPQFFAYDRPVPGAVPVAWFEPPCEYRSLVTFDPPLTPALFWALPPTADAGVPIFECRQRGRITYGLDAGECPELAVLARVFPTPLREQFPVDDYSAPLKAWAGADQCVAGGGTTPDGGFAVALSASASRARGLSIDRYRWDALSGTLEGPNVVFVLPQGTHQVTLTVFGSDGTIASDVVAVDVRPEAIITPPPGCGCGCSSAAGLLAALAVALLLRRRTAAVS